MLLTSSCSMIPGLKMPDSWKSLTGSKTNSVVAAQKVDENVKQLTEADKLISQTLRLKVGDGFFESNLPANFWSPSKLFLSKPDIRLPGNWVILR